VPDSTARDVVAIHGFCAPQFSLVREAFLRNFTERGEVGAAVAICVDGELVVDLWGGWADGRRQRRWQRDTLVNVFSVGKAMAALSLLLLIDRREVDLDAPVSRYWPPFAAGGKADVTPRMLLGHRAGLPAVRRTLPRDAMYDWEKMTRVLAEEIPWWPPNSAHGYHVNTFGFLIGEIVRRVSGQSIGHFFRREIAAPVDADFHFGIGVDQEHRIAEYLFGSELGASESIETDSAVDSRTHLLRQVYFNPPGISGLGTANSRAWRAAEMPSTNGHANARAIARLYSPLACGGCIGNRRLLSQRILVEATGEASNGNDLVLQRPSRFGLGFQLTQPERRLGPSPRSFGHFGAGGSLGFADPDARLAFGYTMNLAGPRWQNPRVRALIDALYPAE
jgi:CubicO group peptidase (beta-lactamase class C family)